MCGRFYLDVDFEELIHKYGSFEELEWEINHGEIYPTNTVGVFVQGQCMSFKAMAWGLTPSYAKRPLINARSESVLDKPTFKQATLLRRCIVPASYYYEWRGVKGHKEKFKMYSKSMDILSMAGIYDSKHEKFAIITRDAHDSIAEIHNRMPLILSDDLVKIWLDADTQVAELRQILNFNYEQMAFEGTELSLF